MRLDAVGMIRGGVAVLGHLARASGDSAPAPVPARRGLDRTAETVRASCRAIEAWEAAGAAERLAALRAFYARSAAAGEYVVAERSPAA